MNTVPIIFIYQHLPQVLPVNMKMDKTPLEVEWLVSKFEPCHYVYPFYTPKCFLEVTTQRGTSMFQHLVISCIKTWTRHLPKILLGSKTLKTFLSWANRLVRSAALRYRSTILSGKVSEFDIWGWVWCAVCKMLQDCWHLMDALLGIILLGFCDARDWGKLTLRTMVQ